MIALGIYILAVASFYIVYEDIDPNTPREHGVNLVAAFLWPIVLPLYLIFYFWQK